MGKIEEATNRNIIHIMVEQAIAKGADRKRLTMRASRVAQRYLWMLREGQPHNDPLPSYPIPQLVGLYIGEDYAIPVYDGNELTQLAVQLSSHGVAVATAHLKDVYGWLAAVESAVNHG